LTAITLFQLSTSISVTGRGGRSANTAALLIRMSILPKRSIVLSTKAFTEASSLTSKCRLVAAPCPCRAEMSCAAGAPSSTSPIMTCAPSAANASA
jgi:hypothetical protein